MVNYRFFSIILRNILLVIIIVYTFANWLKQKSSNRQFFIFYYLTFVEIYLCA